MKGVLNKYFKNFEHYYSCFICFLTYKASQFFYYLVNSNH